MCLTTNAEYADGGVPPQKPPGIVMMFCEQV